MKFNINILFFIYIYISNIIYAEELLKVGCFESKDVQGFIKVNNTNIKKTASDCISYCKNIFKVFAGLQNGGICLCGEYYGGIDVDSCNINCIDNHNETCGGTLYVSVYETVPGGLGAPRTLKFIKSLENAIHISWNPPASNIANIKQYKVSANPVFYFTDVMRPVMKHYKFSPLTQTAMLDGLHPGTKYNITIIASSENGDSFPASIESWTKVGIPDVPKVPQLLSRTPTTMIVQIEKVIPTGGPISTYQIVVVDETLPVIIDFNLLDSYQEISREGLPYYIAAEIQPEDFETIFTVGNKKYYGKYYNAPLGLKKDYHILLGVTSTINETKSAYSESVHTQHESSHIHFYHDHHSYEEEDHDHEDTQSNSDIEFDNRMIIVLSVAVGLFAFLLVMSVIIFLVLRIYFKKNTRQSIDHQELAIHAHIPNQDYENGYVIGNHYLDDEEISPDYYRHLREKVYIYSHHIINIVADIGIGKFGEVKKGVLCNTGSEQVSILIHRIQDNSLNPTMKSEMLKDFDSHIKIGKHHNIVNLLGLMEELNIISVVFEYETLSLKSNLIESRAVQHYPVYAEKNRRFSTLQEQQVLEILVGVAKGMNHIYSLNIPHGQLCSRNIALRDGIHPKITGFGLIHHHNDVYIPDYRRWQSPEDTRSKRPTCTGDVWSFACLIWEVLTVGGTPYSDVRNDELTTRIVRGLRLAQPQYVSDELYQSMLLCWQNDPDERPSFKDMEAVIERVAKDDVTPHVLFSLYPSFQYELYSPHLEFID